MALGLPDCLVLLWHGVDRALVDNDNNDGGGNSQHRTTSCTHNKIIFFSFISVFFQFLSIFTVHEHVRYANECLRFAESATYFEYLMLFGLRVAYGLLLSLSLSLFTAQCHLELSFTFK